MGQIVKAAGQIAGITGVRCSPHTCRHTFAIEFLRGGGDVFELQQLLGYESLEMVRRYVKKAKADLEEAHRKASPANRLKLR